MNIKVCHLTSVHNALDTRIFYRFCIFLSSHYQVTLIGVHPKKEIVSGIQIIPFYRFKNKIFRLLFTWIIMFVKAIWVNAKIYQLHDPELIPCGLLLRLCGKKVILDIHENVAEDIFDKPWIKYKKLLYLAFALFEKPAIWCFKLLLAENSYENRYRRLRANYTTILNYHDSDFFTAYKSPVNRNSNRIFYIGIILKSRGIIEIIKAMHLLHKEGITVYFDIVGELYTELAVEIDALPFIKDIKEQIVFHGRLPLEKGYEISRNAAIGMCIIHPMSNSIGSYPTKMFEYMAIGLPQIISNFDLYRSVVESHQCGICVNPMNPVFIAEAIRELLQNRELALAMGQNGIDASLNYTWKSQFQKVLQVYKQLECK